MAVSCRALLQAHKAARFLPRELKRSISDFLEDRAQVWTGLDTTEFDEVERHRAVSDMPGRRDGRARTPEIFDGDGDESLLEGRTMEGFPDFGREMRKYWAFDENCAYRFRSTLLTPDVNLNHGEKAAKSVSQESSDHVRVVRLSSVAGHRGDAADDQGRGEEPGSMASPLVAPKTKHSEGRGMTRVRSHGSVTQLQVAEMIGAQRHELVLVPNATQGVHTIIHNLDWSEGDIIVICQWISLACASQPS